MIPSEASSLIVKPDGGVSCVTEAGIIELEEFEFASLEREDDLRVAGTSLVRESELTAPVNVRFGASARTGFIQCGWRMLRGSFSDRLYETSPSQFILCGLIFLVLQRLYTTPRHGDL